jgi:hypothetical protein
LFNSKHRSATDSRL